jgi:hypothetical protein
VHYFGARLKKKREAGKSWQPKAVFAGVLVLVYGGGLAIHQFALTRDHHGVTPYQTIFQQDFYPEYTAALSGETLVPRNDVPMEPEDPGLSELNELPAPEPISPQPPQTDPSQPETPVAGAPVQVPIDQFIS